MIDPVATPAAPQPAEPIEPLLDEILREGGAALQCLAGAIAGNLGLRRFAPRLDELRTRTTGVISQTFELAVERMAEGAVR